MGESHRAAALDVNHEWGGRAQSCGGSQSPILAVQLIGDPLTPARTDLDIVAAARTLSAFADSSLTDRIGKLERRFAGRNGAEISALTSEERVGHELLDAAYFFKRLAGQINVMIHTIGILLCLPHLLEPNETIEYLSLGAGNTGKAFDLETDRRIAEFKFIHWQGGSEAIRQNALFKDFYGLAEHATHKRKLLYVLGVDHPLNFLRGGRSLSSVMSRNRKLWTEFRERYGEQFTKVGEYFRSKESEVELVSILEHLPGLDPDSRDASFAQQRRGECTNGVAAYSASRLLFRAGIIEPLNPTDRIRIETRDGVFEMTKADFYRVFPNVVRSESYRVSGVYHYARTPEKAYQFLSR